MVGFFHSTSDREYDTFKKVSWIWRKIGRTLTHSIFLLPPPSSHFYLPLLSSPLPLPPPLLISLLFRWPLISGMTVHSTQLSGELLNSAQLVHTYHFRISSTLSLLALRDEGAELAPRIIFTDDESVREVVGVAVDPSSGCSRGS